MQRTCRISAAPHNVRDLVDSVRIGYYFSLIHPLSSPYDNQRVEGHSGPLDRLVPDASLSDR